MKKIVIIGNIASMMLRFRKELIINLVSQGDDVYCLANDFSPEDLKLLSSWGGKGIKYTLNSKGI
ncbi:glycosyltransferase family 4 protein, partial [Salmonella enterica]|nr:glycosyltransferase family 4 protein [Salmonella enterica]